MSGDAVLDALWQVILQRRAADPAESYVAKLHQDGIDRILKKFGEEATEVIIAAKDSAPGNTDALIHEIADLWFHALVLLDHVGESPESVYRELRGRFGTSGIAEKAARKRGN